MIAMSHRDQRGSNAHAAVAPSTPILIVDQDRAISTSLSFMLSARGYDDVRAVRSTARAIAVAATFHPGIVFLDIERPETESLDLATLLRRGAGHHAMRLIAMTRSVEHELRDDARRAGFERYLVKPLSQVELDKVLRLPRTAAE
jgi:CheY-like chemotaxis protein